MAGTAETTNSVLYDGAKCCLPHNIGKSPQTHSFTSCTHSQLTKEKPDARASQNHKFLQFTKEQGSVSVLYHGVDQRLPYNISKNPQNDNFPPCTLSIIKEKPGGRENRNHELFQLPKV